MKYNGKQIKEVEDVKGQFSCPDCVLQSAQRCIEAQKDYGLRNCVKNHIHFEYDEIEEHSPENLDPDMKVFNTDEL